jgi:hypothetical protein
MEQVERDRYRIGAVKDTCRDITASRSREGPILDSRCLILFSIMTIAAILPQRSLSAALITMSCGNAKAFAPPRIPTPS